MNKPKKTAEIKVRLTPASRTALERYASDTGLDLSDVARLALSRFLSSSVERDRSFVPHEQVC